MSQALQFDQIQVGMRWRSPGRTVTETDIVNFACHSGDFNPLHVDHRAAEKSVFGRPIAHGLLGLSWVAGLGSNYPLADTLAFVGIDDWRFLKPIYVGDTLHVVTEVRGKKRTGRRHGEIEWHRTLINQDGVSVQAGVFRTLVAAKTAQRQSGSYARSVG